MQAGWRELRAGTVCAEARQQVRMHLGGALAEDVFRKLLAGEWGGLQGQYLLAGQFFARDVRWRDVNFFKRKE